MNEKDTSKLTVPVSEPLGLAAMVEYSDGSIVSKEIMKNDAGGITLFAFDAGQGLSEHSAPFDAFVQVLGGKATLTIGGKEVEAVPGQAVIMPANVPHAVDAKERFKMMLVMIKG